jgi:hypothetical protein
MDQLFPVLPELLSMPCKLKAVLLYQLEQTDSRAVLTHNRAKNGQSRVTDISKITEREKQSTFIGWGCY